MQKNQKWLLGGMVGAVLLSICVCLVVLAVGGAAAWGWTRTVQSENGSQTGVPNITQEVTVEALPLTETPAPTTAVDEPPPTRTPAAADDLTLDGAGETLRTLEEEVVPINDLRRLAERLEGKQNIPETLTGVPEELQVGAQKTFYASNVDTNQHFQVDATLAYVTPHLYFWIENGVDYNESALKRLAETFETKIYPTNRSFFGSEWSPGVDNDVHLYVLYARNLGRSILGYFSSVDQFVPEAREYSNGHEMFILSADNASLQGEQMASVMAHEFQHMIHWYRDRNEEGWVNEGFSELAQLINGYEPGNSPIVFSQNPDLQLNYWPEAEVMYPHYGAAFLYVAYFLDRFGAEATQALVADQNNGMASIDNVLAGMDAVDPSTGSPVRADDVFADWAVTNYLNNPEVGDGRYAYKQYGQALEFQVADNINDCSSEEQGRTVKQYGTDYIRVRCSGSHTLRFQGNSGVGVLPVGAYSGDYAFWSNRGDESAMTLTREFDFTGASGPLTLQYQTWFDIEKDYDYLYLVASTDGETWQILKTPSGTADDPTGANYGWGYNGESGGWIEEQVDLSEFAGKKVTLQFEYITDTMMNDNGFLLDDVRIPEIQYSEDFETGDGGWVGEGFVRIQNILPQTYRVSVIRNGRTISVETVTLDENQSAAIPLDFGVDMREVVVVVSGTTRFTIQDAQYSFWFE